VKTNRVRGAHARPRGAFDPSPQRAKLQRQRTRKAGELWTVISISIRVDDLLAVDRIAERLGMSRSMLLVEAAKRVEP
jgi:hypothetical protein